MERCRRRRTSTHSTSAVYSRVNQLLLGGQQRSDFRVPKSQPTPYHSQLALATRHSSTAHPDRLFPSVICKRPNGRSTAPFTGYLNYYTIVRKYTSVVEPEPLRKRRVCHSLFAALLQTRSCLYPTLVHNAQWYPNGIRDFNSYSASAPESAPARPPRLKLCRLELVVATPCRSRCICHVPDNRRARP